MTPNVHETATYRCDDTRGCVMQFWPPDDEHMCSKHVQTWNKLIVKQILCIKLVKYWDKCLKHVEFYSKDKFEKLVHLVGFSIRLNYNITLCYSYAELFPRNFIFTDKITAKIVELWCNCNKQFILCRVRNTLWSCLFHIEDIFFLQNTQQKYKWGRNRYVYPCLRMQAHVKL